MHRSLKRSQAYVGSALLAALMCLPTIAPRAATQPSTTNAVITSLEPFFETRGETESVILAALQRHPDATTLAKMQSQYAALSGKSNGFLLFLTSTLRAGVYDQGAIHDGLTGIQSDAKSFADTANTVKAPGQQFAFFPLATKLITSLRQLVTLNNNLKQLFNKDQQQRDALADSIDKSAQWRTWDSIVGSLPSPSPSIAPTQSAAISSPAPDKPAIPTVTPSTMPSTMPSP